MCSECHMIPCHPNCPNAPAPLAVYRCKHCDEDIYLGDECVEFDGDYYHTECFDDCAASILRNLYGAIDMIAEDCDD